MTYTLGPLPDDPSQERILLEVIRNPRGRHETVKYCIDVATVTPGTEVRCDGEAWSLSLAASTAPVLDRYGVWPQVDYRGTSSSTAEQRERRKAAKADGTYLPRLGELLAMEQSANHRRQRKAEWMRKHRQQQQRDIEPVQCICTHCGETFTPKRSTAKTCSTRCRVAAHRAAALQHSTPPNHPPVGYTQPVPDNDNPHPQIDVDGRPCAP